MLLIGNAVRFVFVNVTLRRVDAGLQSPTIYQYALSIERQLPFKMRGALYFVGSRTIHQLRTRNINAPVCGLTTVCPTNAQQLQLLRPDAAQGNVYEYEANGISNQQKLLFNVSSH